MSNIGWRIDDKQKLLKIWIDKIPYTTNFNNLINGVEDIGIHSITVYKPDSPIAIMI